MIGFMLESPEKRPQISGIILAGGYSKRMGTDKAQLLIDSETFLQHLVHLMAEHFTEIIIVFGCAMLDHPPARSVRDIFPGMGPLGGIHAGLSAASYPTAFVTACDMPFFDPALTRFLTEKAFGYEAAVPQDGTYIEPLCSVYTTSLVPKIEAYLKAGNRKTTAFLRTMNTRYLPISEIRDFADSDKAFFNVNTPKEYQWLKEQT